MKNFLINAVIFLLVLMGGLFVGWHFIQEDVIRYFTQVPIEAESFDVNLVNALEEVEEIEENGTNDLDMITALGAFDWLDHIGLIEELEIGPIGEVIMPSIDVRVPIFLGYHEPNISIGAGTYRPYYMWDAPEKRMGENNFVLASHWDPNPGIRFGGIDQLQVGDLLILRDSNYLYLYETIIGDNYIIGSDRSDIAHIDPDHTWLTLFTCTPDGDPYRRVMVRGEFVEKLSIVELIELMEEAEAAEEANALAAARALEALAEAEIDMEVIANVVENLDDTEVFFPTADVAIATSGALFFAIVIVWIANLGPKKK